MKMPDIQRRATRPVGVGAVTIGGAAPVSVQSMTNTPTADVEATAAQVHALSEAGAQLVRVAVPTPADTAGLARIVEAAPVPIIADVHFHYARAIEAIEAGVHKIRLNPGNIADAKQVARVIDAARAHGTAIRVGVNEGSVVERKDDARRLAELARPLDELMADKLAEYVQRFEAAGFERLVLSAKSSDAFTTVAVNRHLADRWDYPLHLGVTHAGTAETGAIRSAAALGALLAEGIGDTVRISYAGDPVAEVRAAVELLASLRLRARRGLELIACPTCGRLQMDLEPVIEQVQAELADLPAPVSVAIMGCVVNGPGEAEGADVAICAGKGKAVLYSAGKKIATVPAEQIVPAVVAEARRVASRTHRSG